jgi:hypothetical protein
MEIRFETNEELINQLNETQLRMAYEKAQQGYDREDLRIAVENGANSYRTSILSEDELAELAEDYRDRIGSSNEWFAIADDVLADHMRDTPLSPDNVYAVSYQCNDGAEKQVYFTGVKTLEALGAVWTIFANINGIDAENATGWAEAEPGHNEAVTEWELIRPYVWMHVSSAKVNQRVQKHYPHRIVKDNVITYCAHFGQYEETGYTITADVADSLGVSEADLYEAAAHRAKYEAEISI